MKKVLFLTIAIILLAAILSAIGRSFNTFETMNITSYPMLVDSTEQLITYDITDCRLDLACGQIPDTTNEQVILCAAAAFTGKCLDYFEHTNILGKHISNGVLYDGYTENKDGVPFEQRYALFVWQGMDSEGNMLKKGFYPLPNDELLLQTQKQHGMAFTQHWVIKDGQIFSPCIQPLDRKEHFRSLCQKGNRYIVVANREEMSYQEYLEELLVYGIENALYMDMGTGWNHSFYRDANNTLHIIHPKTHSYPTNWIIVLK
jgi:hypothetical protein